MEEARCLNTPKRLLISTVVLALSIILRPIHTTALPDAEPQSAESLKNQRSQIDNPDHAEADPNGTAQEALPATGTQNTDKSKQETAHVQQGAPDEASTDIPLDVITLIIAIMAIVQACVFWYQGTQLKATVEKMDEIAKDQAKDMSMYIFQVTRSANEMERVAASLDISADSVVQSVAINREIADRQKLITELQSRAYIAIEHLGVVPQNSAIGVRLEPRVSLVNKGNTPAYKVRFSAAADIVPVPLPEDFSFPLTDIDRTSKGSIIASTLNKFVTAVVPKLYDDTEITDMKNGVGKRLAMWGKVIYEDCFGIERYVVWGQTYVWFPDGTNWTLEIPNHQRFQLKACLSRTTGYTLESRVSSSFQSPFLRGSWPYQ